MDVGTVVCGWDEMFFTLILLYLFFPCNKILFPKTKMKNRHD
jgi:hypothetical protein